MSSIYDALQRIQEEKDTWSSPIRQEEPPVERTTIRVVLAAVVISSLCTAAVFFGIHFLGGKNPGTQKASPVSVAAGTAKPAGLQEVNVFASPSTPPAMQQAQRAPGQVSPPSDTVEGYLALGEKYFTVNDYDKALLTYTKALHYFRKDARLLNNIGNVFLAKGQADKAIHYFTEAISISKDSVEPVYNMACAYAAMGNKAKAISYLKKACAQNPEAKGWAVSDPDLAQFKGTRDFDRIIGAH